MYLLTGREIQKLLQYFIFSAIFIAGLLFFAPQKAHAAVRTWDGGGGDNNWSTAANWSDDTIPTGADTARFDATSVKNATVDASFAGEVEDLIITSGYSGTITLARNLKVDFGATGLSIAGGTIDMDTFNLDIDRNDAAFTGGTINADAVSPGTLRVTNDISFGAGFSANLNGGTFEIGGDAFGENTSMTCPTADYDVDTVLNVDTFVWTKQDNLDLVIGSNCDLDNVSIDTPSAIEGAELVNNGNITFTGDMMFGGFVNNGTVTAGVADYANSIGAFTLSATSTTDFSGVDELVLLRDGDTPKLTIASGASFTFKDGGKIFLSDGAEVDDDINATGYTLYIEARDGTDSGRDYEFNVPINGDVIIRENDTEHASYSGIEDGIFDSTVGPDTVTLDIVADMDINGDLTVYGLNMSNPVSEYTITVSGDLAFAYSLDSRTPDFGGANLPIVLDGTGAQSVSTTTYHDVNSPITINKSSGTVTLTTNFETNTTCAVTDGGLDLAGYNLDCASGLTLSSGSDFIIDGDETVTSLTFNSGVNLEVQGDGDAAADTYTFGAGGAVLADISSPDATLTVNMTDTTDTLTLAATLDLAGDLNLTSGTLDMSTYDATVAGDIVTGANGVLEANSQTVTLDGTAQTITGDITFYNLTKNVESADSLTITAGDEVTIEGTLDLKGDAVDDELTLSSDTEEVEALLTLGESAISDLEYVDVMDIDSSNGLQVSCTVSCINSGNNTNWTFGRSSSKNRGSYSAPNPEIDAYIAEETDTEYTVSWVVADISSAIVNIYLQHGESAEEQLARNYDDTSYTIEKSTLFSNGVTTASLRIALTDLAEDLDDSTIVFTVGGNPEVVTEETTEETDETTEEDTTEETDDTNVSSFATGTLIKRADLPDVYIVAKDGTRKPFFNQFVFFAYNLSFDDIVTVTAEEMSALPLGRAVPMPSTKLLHFMGSSKVFEVLNTDLPTGESSIKPQIRHIPSEAEAIAVHGSDWKDKIISLPVGFFASYEVVE